MSEQRRPQLKVAQKELFGPAPGKRRRRRRRRRFRWLRRIRSRALQFALIALSLVIIVTVLSAVLISNAILDVRSAQSSLNRRFDMLRLAPATELSIQDFENISTSVQELNAALNRLNTRTALIQPFAALGGKDVEIQLEMMQAGIHLTRGTSFWLDGLEPTIVLLQRGGVLENEVPSERVPLATGIRAVELMDAGKVQFLNARTEFQNAQHLLYDLNLDGISADILLDVEALRSYTEQMETYTELALVSPDLLTVALGIDEPRVYLILAQNNDEIRPSGGYISTWGWMRVRNGRIQDQEYYPTTQDNPRPPAESIAQTFEVPKWWGSYSEPVYAAWDGSWHADFSSTAALAAWYYNNGNNPSVPVGGVIGVDLIAVQYLVEALGEIYVSEYGVMVDAENFREVIYQIRAEREKPLDHKQFVAAMFLQVVQEWQQADPKTQGAINQALLQALREKHIMLYFNDGAMQAAVEELHWAGAQADATHNDYLMVADANVNGDKSSSSVYRQLTYDVRIDTNGAVRSALSIFYDFPASLAELDPAVAPEHYGTNKNYGTLTQIFAPTGSQLVSSQSETSMRVVEQEKHTVIAGYVSVMFDDSALVQVDYDNAYTVEALGPYKRYHLLVQKQAGTQNDPVNVTIYLPPGARILSVSPQPEAQYNLGQPVLEFNLLLRQDEWIEVIYE